MSISRAKGLKLMALKFYMNNAYYMPYLQTHLVFYETY